MSSTFVILFTISTSSFEYIFIFTSRLAFILTFLPFITLHSISFTLHFVSNIIPSLQPWTAMFSEKSKLQFKALRLSSLLSGKYITYVFIQPSILTLSSDTSFLYKHTFPDTLIVFKISGFESGTIISLFTKINSFFSATSLLIHIFSLLTCTSINLTS